MTRATKPSASCTVVVLDPAWRRLLPGVERLVRKAARAAIGARVRSLTVALADDKRVRALNARDRRKDKPTNVLSYPSGERSFLGDVVLARQTVWREAKEQRKRRPITSSISWCTARSICWVTTTRRALRMPTEWRRWSAVS